MTVTELQQQLEEWREVYRGLSVKISALTEQLKLVCDHSKPEPYKWESDNGYGRQRWITGQRCTYCGYVDLWNRGRFLDTAELDY